MNLSIYCDGGARGNPGPAAIGFIINHHKKTLFKEGVFIGSATNNVAEYQAVIAALSWLIKNQTSLPALIGEPDNKNQPSYKKSLTKENKTSNLNLTFFLDSKLVVNQLSGNYKINKPHLKKLSTVVFKYLKILKAKPFFNYIPREQNSEADLLLNKAMDRAL